MARNSCKITIFNPSQDPRLKFDQIIYVIDQSIFCSDEIPVLRQTAFKSKFSVAPSIDQIIINLNLSLGDILKTGNNSNETISIDYENSFSQPIITMPTHGQPFIFLDTQLQFRKNPIWIYVKIEPLNRINRNTEIYRLSIQKDNPRLPKFFIGERKMLKISPRNFKAIERTLWSPDSQN